MSRPPTGGRCLKTRLGQAPGVFSAIVCHLPQLVLFHFVTVSAASSSNDRNTNRLSELPGGKPAHRTCKTSELARSVAPLVAQMLVDRLIVAGGGLCVLYLHFYNVWCEDIVNYKQLSHPRVEL